MSKDTTEVRGSNGRLTSIHITGYWGEASRTIALELAIMSNEQNGTGLTDQGTKAILDRAERFHEFIIKGEKRSGVTVL